MKAILGVDNAGLYRPALNLLSRLKFENLELTVAHSIDVMVPVPMYGLSPEADVGIEFAENLHEIGEQALSEAVDGACSRGMRPDSVLLTGAAGPALVEFADRERYELIAIHSVRKGALGSLFLGSVARSLAIGAHESVLIAKDGIAPSGTLKAVFATDHSDYADKALDKFLEMRARGIESVHVISAAWLNEYQAFVAQYDLGKGEGSTQEWVEAQLRKKNRDLVEKLRGAGYEATSNVTPGAPDAAIRDAMETTKADLLIMGAQGHGFMHRLFIGSTSLHQVVAEPYSVLIVRLPREGSTVGPAR